MSDSWQTEELPNLNSENYRITNPSTPRYNCIAWAIGSDTQWRWPIRPYYWPPGVPEEETLSAFLAAFATRGYEECKDGSLEAGYERVALFANRTASGDFSPTHVARQLPDGRWTSKLGPCEDIEHVKVEDVNGPAYGTVVRFMRRARAEGVL